MLKLKEIRLEKQMSQRELAERLGLTAHNIGDWERGKCEPSIFFLDKIANQFGCTVDYLIGREDDFGNVETNADLSEEEKEILATYRALPAQRRKTFMYFVQSCKEELNVVKNYKI